MCSRCAFSASNDIGSRRTLRTPAAVFGVSASLAAAVNPLDTLTSPRCQSMSPHSSATSSDVRRPVQKANCSRFRYCPVAAARMARCSSGLNGSISSSVRGLPFTEYVQPARGFDSISSSSTASLRAERRHDCTLANRLLVADILAIAVLTSLRVTDASARLPSAGTSTPATILR
ncbi:hypothetical protein D3C75_864770 [compost metagenome]